MSTIKNNLLSIQETIAKTADKHQECSHAVKLLAVSKTKPSSQIEEAYHAGQLAFGENYLQEAVDKIATLAHLTNIEWHFIGPIQSNKTKLIAQNFNWVQSVDRLKVAQRLNEQRLSAVCAKTSTPLPPLNACIQVNISAEASKSGLSANEVAELAAFIDNAKGLNLRGLMAIPEKNAPLSRYTQMHNLFSSLKSQYNSIDTLSMGMSNDMPTAIAAGSTMVRIGTAIFGARDVNVK